MSELTNINDTFNGLKLKVEEFIEKYRGPLFELVEKELISIISTHKEKLLKSNANYLTWTQYTPYFNDGDACVFSSNFGNFQWRNSDDYGYLEIDEEFLYSIEQEIKDSELGRIDDDLWENISNDDSNCRFFFDVKNDKLIINWYDPS